MSERGMFPPGLADVPADVMVTMWNPERASDAIRLAGELRAAGLRVDVYPDADKIGKQFKYADARGIRFVTVVGDDEAARNEVAVKNLATGEQQLVARGDVAKLIKHGGATR
jgi:histidyl-tRNA synthetase